MQAALQKSFERRPLVSRLSIVTALVMFEVFVGAALAPLVFDPVIAHGCGALAGCSAGIFTAVFLTGFGLSRP